MEVSSDTRDFEFMLVEKKSHGMGEFICSVFTVKCGKQMKVNIESEMGMTKQFAIECQ